MVVIKRGVVLGVGLVSVVLSGCGHYKSDFACKGYPENSTCRPTTEVYAMRHEQLTRMKSEDGDSSASGSSPASTTPAVVDRVAAVAGQTEFHLGQPNISQAQVLQVWIAPWRDAKNFLHEASLVYAIVEPADWLYGRKPKHIEKLASQNTFAPLMSRSLVEPQRAKTGPNGGMPMMAAPLATSVPQAAPMSPPAATDPSAILRQLQQQMPSVPGAGAIPTPFGGPQPGVDPEMLQEQKYERMQEQRDRMIP